MRSTTSSGRWEEGACDRRASSSLVDGGRQHGASVHDGGSGGEEAREQAAEAEVSSEDTWTNKQQRQRGSWFPVLVCVCEVQQRCGGPLLGYWAEPMWRVWAGLRATLAGEVRHEWMTGRATINAWFGFRCFGCYSIKTEPDTKTPKLRFGVSVSVKKCPVPCAGVSVFPSAKRLGAEVGSFWDVFFQCCQKFWIGRVFWELLEMLLGRLIL